MSKLIDDICRSDPQIYRDNNGDRWMKKPTGKDPLKRRISDAMRILKGTSRAYHYKEDENENEK